MTTIDYPDGLSPEDHQPRWRGLDDAARSKAYSPSSMLDGPLDPLIAAYGEKSAAARTACAPIQTLHYGAAPAQKLDFARPSTATDQAPPLHVFIHGGYWCELSVKESFFAGPDSLARGFAFAALDYTLAPRATLEAIVAECVDALCFLQDEADSLGFDTSRIIVSGSSAGAHLAAMASLHLPPDRRPRALALLSGIYDLEPLLGTYINEPLNLDTVRARALSPLYGTLDGFPPSFLTWGEQETDEFKRQSLAFAHALRSAGVPVEARESAGRNHFDIVFDLAGASPMGTFLSAQALNHQ